MERAEGYYQVKMLLPGRKEAWGTAFYSKGVWGVAFTDKCYSDADFSEIDENRILMPDEPDNSYNWSELANIAHDTVDFDGCFDRSDFIEAAQGEFTIRRKLTP